MSDVLSVHFIGVAGIGMRGIARLCLQKGYQVSGSDSADTFTLVEMGLKVVSEDANLEALNPDWVVYSSAILESHPQRIWAEKKGRLCHRAQFLARLFNEGKTRIAIAGSHGKTTVSSWLSHILSLLEDASYCVGGVIRTTGQTANLGVSTTWVIEADESDGSLKYFDPNCVVLTNINDDHMNHWKSLGALEEFMLEYVQKSPARILCQDDPRIKKWPIEALRYGFDPSSDLIIDSFELAKEGIKASLSYKGDDLGYFHSALMGRHNLQNMAAVVGVCLSIGLDIKEVKPYLASFKGAARRLEPIGEVRGIKYFDDYAVHPREIETTIQALRTMLQGNEKLRIIFQPHRTSRLENLMLEMAKSLEAADEVWLCPLYLASEVAKEGVDSSALGRLFLELYPNKHLKLFNSFEEIEEALEKEVKPSVSICSTMGAGSVTQLARRFVKNRS